ncbi:MAG: prepilin-type N-terminal cleavage/methylation domain-containing protein [Candidatus Saelkia tenebricola]|nr:prepilin-type N-terminal cleavage/methylation domain-containing protein [Candidatus Saelkia tenebricola]
MSRNKEKIWYNIKRMKSFTLIEVIVAVVLLTVGVAGGISGYKVADRQIELSNIKHMALSENKRIQEIAASWDIDDPELVEGVYPIDVSAGFDDQYSPDALYEVKDVLDSEGNLLYKEITVKVELPDRNIEVKTQTIKSSYGEAIEGVCGDGKVNQPSEDCDPDPPNPGICDENCNWIPGPT